MRRALQRIPRTARAVYDGSSTSVPNSESAVWQFIKEHVLPDSHIS